MVPKKSRLLLCLVVFALALSVYTSLVVSYILIVFREAKGATPETVRSIVRQEMTPVQTITTSWTSAQGQHSISTTKNGNETVEDWLARHQAAVTAAQKLFKPI